MVGTEAALHRVDHAGLVVFLDFDQHLLAPRFGAGEEALALLARAARVVGRRSGEGRVLVQTRIPGHEALLAAVAGRPRTAVRRGGARPPTARPARRSAPWPRLRGPGAPQYAAGLRDEPGLEVSSTGDDRFLARADDHTVLADGLAAVPRPAARLRVEVDPTDV